MKLINVAHGAPVCYYKKVNGMKNVFEQHSTAITQITRTYEREELVYDRVIHQYLLLDFNAHNQDRPLTETDFWYFVEAKLQIPVHLLIECHDKALAMFRRLGKKHKNVFLMTVPVTKISLLC